MRFYIVDVFAESKFAGNQLAVFRDAGSLSTEQMQRIAQEMHYSETTFITSEDRHAGGYDVRIFMPDRELPFAGHPTLGTAWVVQSKVIGKPEAVVRLNMGVGQIPVTFSYSKGRADVIWMRQKEPTFGETFKPKAVAGILGLKESDFDPKFPIMEVSTGASFVITPLKSLAAVKTMQFDPVACRKFLSGTHSMGFLVFTSETYSKKNDLNVRVLGVSPAIPEDPATGSGNGCLAAYLVKTKYFGKESVDLKVEQGYEIDRRSLILLRAKRSGKSIEVNVGGRVQFIASGELTA
ncbi:MAG TPA: PhzF family phenazine biosynthesis protein [Nitrososphaerales archaeon]|nr:PhzF family phenazine biosynthesis protein [Nitrososphaerales archaeon]